MSFGRFGAKPRGMSNPTYWVSRHLQDQRKIAANQFATEKFNEKWHRLNAVFDKLAEHFVSTLDGKAIPVKESYRLDACWDAATQSKAFIEANVNTCSAAELSKYATSLKKLALIAFELCRRCAVYDDIADFGYDAQAKTFMLNGSPIYFLG